MNYTRKTDYDTLYFNNSDDYVNLKNILADLIALAEPIKTLCRKECTGLCPTCGIEKLIHAIAMCMQITMLGTSLKI